MSGGHTLNRAAAGKVTTMTITASHWTPLGITDEQSVCDQCGKQHLKRVVVLEHNESHEIRRVGTTCAGHMLGGRMIADKVIGRATMLQQIVDILRKDGLEAAKDWTLVRGIGVDIYKTGHPQRNIWIVHLSQQPRMLVTDHCVSRARL